MPSQHDNEEERNERIDLFLRERRAQVEQVADRSDKPKRMATAIHRQRIAHRPDGSSRDPKPPADSGVTPPPGSLAKVRMPRGRRPFRGG